ncbi:MAG: class I SAM-dependent methyltransferase [Bacteroidota bacterium]
MYTRFQLAKKFLHYYFTAANGKGHGTHSPFVFNFINNVLRDKSDYPAYTPVEKRRQSLLGDASAIDVEDFGAGSGSLKSNKRVIKDIAASSLKPAKFGQLLHRIAHYYQPKTVLELGTSLGITTSYLALGNPAASLVTCEGSGSIGAIAKETFAQLHAKNIQLVEGDFAKTLPSLLPQIQPINLAFIDGNHRRQPTIDYFNQLLEVVTPESILIFDDIHWSEEMEAAWKEIQQHPRVTLTVDLFFIGLVLIDPGFKVKQHFTIRF